jgi:CheY-like chemotaxis protein
MCIDDDTMTLMLNKLMLRKNNFCDDVVSAENGKIAIEYFEEQMTRAEGDRKFPELVFLDLNMPEMNGWEFLDCFLQDFKEVIPELKIIVLSSTVDPEDQKRARKHPLVMEFVTKPLSLGRLDILKKQPALSPYF